MQAHEKLGADKRPLLVHQPRSAREDRRLGAQPRRTINQGLRAGFVNRAGFVKRVGFVKRAGFVNEGVFGRLVVCLLLRLTKTVGAELVDGFDVADRVGTSAAIPGRWWGVEVGKQPDELRVLEHSGAILSTSETRTLVFSSATRLKRWSLAARNDEKTGG